MQDELAVAHEGRRMHILGITKRNDHLTLMQSELSDYISPDSNLPCIELLSMVSGLEPTQYAQSQSMLAIHRVAAQTGEIQPHGSAGSRIFSDKLGMKVQRSGAYVCNECIDEDLAKNTTSWFRRSHHLIGIDLCPIHGTQLHQVVAEKPFLGFPHIWRAEGATFSTETLKGSDPTEIFIRKYADIATNLLIRTRPVHCRILNELIFERAHAIGIGRYRTKDRELLSERLIKLKLDTWLNKHVPKYYMKVSGHAFSTIDNILKLTDMPASGASYALVLAAVYENAADALETVRLADQADSAQMP
jgi:hypothetical protein